jgi:hypothetical protein
LNLIQSDTLIRACLENGQLYNAVSQAHRAKGKWSKGKKIAGRYDTAVDDYIAYYLKKTKAGETKTPSPVLKR